MFHGRREEMREGTTTQLTKKPKADKWPGWTLLSAKLFQIHLLMLLALAAGLVLYLTTSYYYYEGQQQQQQRQRQQQNVLLALYSASLIAFQLMGTLPFCIVDDRFHAAALTTYVLGTTIDGLLSVVVGVDLALQPPTNRHLTNLSAIVITAGLLQLSAVGMAMFHVSAYRNEANLFVSSDGQRQWPNDLEAKRSPLEPPNSQRTVRFASSSQIGGTDRTAQRQQNGGPQGVPVKERVAMTKEQSAEEERDRKASLAVKERLNSLLPATAGRRSETEQSAASSTSTYSEDKEQVSTTCLPSTEISLSSTELTSSSTTQLSDEKSEQTNIQELGEGDFLVEQNGDVALLSMTDADVILSDYCGSDSANNE